MQRVDVGVVGDPVVVGVARDHDRAVQVHRAVAADLPVAPAVGDARQGEEARVRDRVLGRAAPELERHHRHERLERRAGRVGAGQGAVVQRLVGVVVERLPGRRVDAVDEEVRVVPGLRDEREHAPGRRLDRDQRAAEVAERALGDLLQLDVERQREVVARGRRAGRERADPASARVDLDLRRAGHAVQLALVARLDPGLADEVGALVVRLHAVGLEPLEVLVADPPDVAERVRGDLAHRVVAEEPRLDLHAREAVGVRREARHLVVGEPGPDRQALGALDLRAELPEAAAVTGLDLDHLCELADHRFGVARLLRVDLERVLRLVAGEHDAVAVQDQPAVRHQRDEPRCGCPRPWSGSSRAGRAGDR